MNTEKIKKVAALHGWLFFDTMQPDPNYLRFRKGEAIIDIWHTGTVRYIEKPFARAEHMRDNSEEDIEVLFEKL